jgi:pimeloyl-ACP methyl ester carboxylesterase
MDEPVVERLGTRYGLPPARWVDLDGPVLYREWEGPADRTFVCVHGLGGSHLNWMGVAPGLARHGRVVAPDLAGFGHTPRGKRSASLIANRRLLSRFLAEVADPPVILVGNSMGGGISILQAGVEPWSVLALALTDPILPWARGGYPSALVIAVFAAYRIPGVGERLLKRRVAGMTAEEFITQSLRVIAADPSTIDPQVLRAHIELAESRRNIDDAIPAFLEAARSLLALGARPKLVRQVMDRISYPVLLIHGERDRLVPVSFARAAVQRYPAWRLEVFEGVGHAPMMEAPGRWLETMESWLTEVEAAGA